MTGAVLGRKRRGDDVERLGLNGSSMNWGMCACVCVCMCVMVHALLWGEGDNRSSFRFVRRC